jgi:putative endonuclease
MYTKLMGIAVFGRAARKGRLEREDGGVHVYLLRCADGTLYTGWTVDLDRRLAAHAAGKGSRYTRTRLPVELAGAIAMPDRSAAMREEARIKRLTRPQKLALLAGLTR